MPTNAAQPTTTPPSSQPSSTPPGGTSAPTSNEAWRAPDSAPAWARGKTPEEILGIATSLVDALPAASAPTAPTAPAAPAAPSFDFADDEYVSGATLRKALAANAAPNADGIDMVAGTNLAFTRQRFANDFAKYGPEISQKLAKVPRNLWTLDNLETVVKLTRIDHHDEIVREDAQRLAAEMGTTIRSGGSTGTSAPVSKELSLESEKIPAEWKQRAQRAGITESVVDEFCRANDMTPAAFYAQFDKPLNRIVEDIPQRGNG